MSARVMYRALSYAATFDALIAPHAEDRSLCEGGAMNQGALSLRLGLPGIPKCAETIIAERDMRLVAMTGARYHLAQISCAETLDVVVRAKAQGLPVTCAVSAHHLALNEDDVAGYRTFCKTSPPLRAESDRRAMVDGVIRGAIDVIVSSHWPAGPENKRRPFAEADFGAVGLETLLSVGLSLHHDGRVSLAQALAPLTIKPADILRLPSGRLAAGAPADLTLIDVARRYLVEAETLRSKSKNTPFDRRELKGLAMATIVGGRTVFTREGAPHGV